MSLLPFDDRDGFIWFDGALVPWRDARIHVLTHGLHYASSVFEGERIYNGSVFKLTEHSERLAASARILGFEIPWSVAEIDAATRRTVEASGLADAYVRPVAWRGSEVMGVSAQDSRIHLAIAVWPWPSYFVGRYPKITVSELLAILKITKQSLSRVLGELVRQGFIDQQTGARDRRQRLLELTGKGVELERQLSETQRQRIARAYRMAGAEAVEGFRKVMMGMLDDEDRAKFTPPAPARLAVKR